MRRWPVNLVPALTADQMRAVDRAMIEDLHIELVQMMENAGRNLAHLAVSLWSPKAVTVLAGPGGNGGGGLVAARHLANRGVDVQVVLSRPEQDLSPAAAHQLDILGRMELAVAEAPLPADLVVDALIGYSLRGDPSGLASELIEWTHHQGSPVLALDTPSGLDVTTGEPRSPCIRASATLTLALPKVGLLRAPELVGRLFVADISVPLAVYRGVGVVAPPLFAHDTVVELDTRGA